MYCIFVIFWWLDLPSSLRRHTDHCFGIGPHPFASKPTPPPPPLSSQEAHIQTVSDYKITDNFAAALHLIHSQHNRHRLPLVKSSSQSSHVTRVHFSQTQTASNYEEHWIQRHWALFSNFIIKQSFCSKALKFGV